MLSATERVLLLLLICCVRSNYFCSGICAVNSCSAQSENSCTDCQVNWTIGSGTCTLNPTSGYQLVANSSDMTGSTSNLQMLPTSSLQTCGPYKYYGNYDCTTAMQISMASGISVPHYAIEVVVWVILYDDTTWTGSNNINVNLGSITVTRSTTSFDGQQSICQSYKQTYYKIVADFSHENQTAMPITIDIRNDISNSGCKWGFKQAIILAKTCESTCTECSGSSSSQCYSCISSTYLSGNTCSMNCLSGYGSVTGSNICILCDNKCTACSQSSTNCSSCKTGPPNQAFLYSLTCIPTCPTGTYPSSNPNLCNVCASQCAVCTGSSNTECSSCKTGYVLSGTTCDTVCLTQYGYATVSTCVYCSLYCTNCYLVADNCSSCNTSGTNQAFLDSAVSSYPKCTTTCATAGKFANAANHKCDPCDSKCKTCISTATTCLSCNSGDGWLNYICYSTCPNGYFMNGNNCTDCDTKCQLCSGSATTCSSCKTTAYLLNSTCYTICPNPYYNDNHGGSGPTLCLPCNSKCTVCTGPSNTNCNSCDTNFTLSGTTCSSSCLTGYGMTTTTGVCVQCVSPCTGCLNTGTNCVSCQPTPTQLYLILIGLQMTCVSSCPSNYYILTSALTCFLCPSQCLTCANSTYCYDCTVTNLFWNNLCYSSCPAGSVQTSSTNCTSCLDYCKTCDGLIDNCTSCQKSGTYKAFLLATVCYSSCPGGYYGTTNSSNYTVCSLCNAACLTCNGGSAGNCFMCNSPYIQSGNTCATSCASGYGVTSNQLVCVKCNNTCLNCAYLATNCTTCKFTGSQSSFYYNDNITFPKCLMICPTGFVGIAISNSTRNCTPCATGCATCSNITTNCTSCTTGYGLLNNNCYSPCQGFYYLSGGLCQRCSLYCLTCSGTNATCSSCVTGGAYLSYLLNSLCLTSCPNKYYASQTGPTLCLSCDSKCTFCSGSATNCSACVNGSYCLNNTCLTSCPPDYFVYNGTTCNNSIVYLTSINLVLSDFNQKIIFKLEFTHDLNQATFPITTFQTFSFSDPTLNLQLFTLSFNWITSNSYQIVIKPISQIYINNVMVTAKIMPRPSVVHTSPDGVPFSSTIYTRSVSTKWFLIKGSQWSDLQLSIMNSCSAISDSIQSFTTLPGVQQFNKAGLSALIFPGAQLTSASILVNSVPAQNSYEGARFWANAVFFTVPKWQKDKQHQKYVLGTSAQKVYNSSRLLLKQRLTFDGDSIYWRFNRTGFTTFFIFDCYMQMFLIVVSWVLLFVAKCLENRVQQSKISRIYSLFHCFHEISIYYLSLALILEIIYFDITSPTRLASFILCLLFNLYFIVYHLYVYYQLISYPQLQLGSLQYRQIVRKYGYFLKRIRYEQYEDIEQWSPRHLFRPYNYHIVSFYKKYLMVIAVVIFYQFPNYAAGSLIFIQLFEITRFTLTWPFASKARNIVRLSLEIVILIFLLTLFLQTFYMNRISQNNPNTFNDATSSLYLVGWISFICIFIFNVSFFIMLLINLICFARKSNNQQIRQIRRRYYYQKIISFQKSLDSTVTNQILDSWVVKGDLNEQWIQNRQIDSPAIDITVEKFVINKMGEGFTIEMEKITELQIKQPHGTVYKQKVKVKRQINGTIGLTKQISSSFYKTILDIFQQYDPNFHADFLTIKTIANIQAGKYRFGDKVDLKNQTHIQTVCIQYPGQQKNIHKLSVPLNGFPINPEILNPLIFIKTLDRKRLY